MPAIGWKRTSSQAKNDRCSLTSGKYIPVPIHSSGVSSRLNYVLVRLSLF